MDKKVLVLSILFEK